MLTHTQAALIDVQASSDASPGRQDRSGRRRIEQNVIAQRNNLSFAYVITIIVTFGKVFEYWFRICLSVPPQKSNIRISDQELQVLEVINDLGPCSSDKVFEKMPQKIEFLFVIRMLHGLVEKGFLQRIIINQKQLYRTSRQYSYVKSFLNNTDI